MAIVLTITDGTTTVNLSGTDVITEEWQPQPPEPGDEMVVETLGIIIIGGNSAVDATLAKLERLLQQARDHQEKTHEILPIYFKVEIDGIVWRSELYDGKAIQTVDWIKGERAVGTRRASLVVKRSPWWEKDTQVAAYLTNGNGTNQQALNVFNCNDGTGTSPNKKNNWVKTQSATEITGDLPAPALIYFQNTYASGDIGTLMIANNVYSDPANLSPWFEGETGTGDTVDATASGGNYHTYTNSTVSVQKALTSQYGSLQGGFYRVLARLKSAVDWKVQPAIWKGSEADFGPKMTLLSSTVFRLVDLGIIPFHLARGFSNEAALPYSSILFGFRATHAGAASIDVDYIQLTPLDGWRRITILPIVQNYWIYLDEHRRDIYAADNSGNVLWNGSASGGPMMLYPGRENRLHFLWENPNVPECLPAASGYVGVYYRPRRRAL